MPRFKLDRKKQAILAIIAGIIIGMIADNISKNDPNNDLKKVGCYIAFILSLSAIFTGIKILVKRGD